MELLLHRRGVGVGARTSQVELLIHRRGVGVGWGECEQLYPCGDDWLNKASILPGHTPEHLQAPPSSLVDLLPGVLVSPQRWHTPPHASSITCSHQTISPPALRIKVTGGVNRWDLLGCSHLHHQEGDHPDVDQNLREPPLVLLLLMSQVCVEASGEAGPV